MKNKLELEFFNIGGTYQLVAEDLEPFIAMHERLHRIFKEGYRHATDNKGTTDRTQAEV